MTNQRFVEAYSRRTGIKQIIPESWLGKGGVFGVFSLTPIERARRDDGDGNKPTPKPTNGKG